MTLDAARYFCETVKLGVELSDGSATLGIRVGPEWGIGNESHGMGMEDREWKPRHGNEGLGSGMENEGTGMEGM